MRTLVVSEFVTLDGVMEAPGGEPSHPHTGWVAEHGTPELFAYKFQEVQDAESLLLGRVTYESFVGAWPQREGDFADKMNAMPKHVVTSRPEELTWNASAVAGDVVDGVTELKKGDGGPIMVNGSATLVRTLLAAGLVDVVALQVFPMAIGGGLRFWPEERGKVAFRLDDLVQLDSGVLLERFRAV